MAGESNLDLDFETGDLSRFSGLESGSSGAAHQAQVNQTIVLPIWGAYSCRFEVHNSAGDIDSGGTYRSLAARYDTGEVNGQEYYFTSWFYIPSSVNPIQNALIWELHHPNSIFGNIGAVPHALHLRFNAINVRVGGGFNNGQGYSTWEPDIVVINPVPYDTIVKWKARYVFREDNTGVVQYWFDTSGSTTTATWPGTPNLSRTNVATAPWLNTAHNVPLYQEQGVYLGSTAATKVNIVYAGGVRRRLTSAAADATFGVSSPPPPSPNPETFLGNWTTASFVSAVTSVPTQPASQFVGNWTTPSQVLPENFALDPSDDGALTLAALSPGSLTLTPHNPGAL